MLHFSIILFAVFIVILSIAINLSYTTRQENIKLKTELAPIKCGERQYEVEEIFIFHSEKEKDDNFTNSNFTESHCRYHHPDMRYYPRTKPLWINCTFSKEYYFTTGIYLKDEGVVVCLPEKDVNNICLGGFPTGEVDIDNKGVVIIQCRDSNVPSLLFWYGFEHSQTFPEEEFFGD